MIEFFRVYKQFDTHGYVLGGIDLFVDKGEFVFLSGTSGAGKTTLLKHIYMDELPTRGNVFVCGYESRRITRRQIPLLRRKLGIVFQDFKLLYDRTVFENIAFAVRVTGTTERIVKKKVFESLAKTGLSHKSMQMIHHLSGGEQQRVCIARAIVNDPLLLLADEPTGNLDAGIAGEIFELLKKINYWGTTVIMATHDIQLIEQSHYRHLRIDQGRIVQSNTHPLIPKLGTSR